VPVPADIGVDDVQAGAIVELGILEALCRVELPVRAAGVVEDLGEGIEGSVGSRRALRVLPRARREVGWVGRARNRVVLEHQAVLHGVAASRYPALTRRPSTVRRLRLPLWIAISGLMSDQSAALRRQPISR
jgi:hypothetical protein